MDDNLIKNKLNKYMVLYIGETRVAIGLGVQREGGSLIMVWSTNSSCRCFSWTIDHDVVY